MGFLVILKDWKVHVSLNKMIVMFESYVIGENRSYTW